MSLIVQKYGGTSVGTTERIEHVAEKVKKSQQAGHSVVVVVSAMSGETNRLTDLVFAVTDKPSRREMDVVLSTGEQVTIGLLCMALEKRGCVVINTNLQFNFRVSLKFDLGLVASTYALTFDHVVKRCHLKNDISISILISRYISTCTIII